VVTAEHDPGREDLGAAGTGAPLAGVRVVDLSRVLAGPYCAQLLADMGAQVIKVESPEGDESRRWPPLWEGNDVSSNFGSVNRGKLGMTLDLKSEAAPQMLRRLVEWADVLIHNFLPETAGRLGIDYEQMQAVNPRLVFCSLSGYGARGPLRNKQGYDLMMQAFSGAMGLTGYEDSGPVRIGVSFIDMATGMLAYGGVVTALLARQASGRGRWVQVSLLETSVGLLGHHGANWMQAGLQSPKLGSAAGNLSPYQAFLCADGYLVAGATNDRAFRSFCEVLGCTQLLADARFASNALRVDHRDALNEVLYPLFATRTVAQWIEALEARGVPCSPVNSVAQIIEHPQVIANDMVVEVDTDEGTSPRYVGTPFKLSGHAGPTRRAAPHKGAHTTHILRDVLGMEADAIAQLQAAGAV
jgi:crotonobetainyl-CoA:carnitine CoA-transferase CaiB-like acyl-CoA transferase